MKKSTSKRRSGEGKARKQNPLLGFFKRNVFVILAFVVPFVLMMLGFSSIGIYPFGKNQVMVVDMWHQYFPFMVELQHKLTTGGSLLYSWIGAGTNFLALMGYYCSSPLYLLTVLFPREYLTEALALVILMKVGFSGAFFAIYARSKYKRNDWSLVIFGSMYALCAFAMGYYWNVMWLDCVSMLPLVILGLDKLLTENKYRLYVIALAVTMISNYYIGTFVCIFVVFYYIVAYLTRFSPTDWRTLINKTVKVVGFSVIGCGISAAILLPTFFALQNSAASAQIGPQKFAFFENTLDIINNMLVNTKPTSLDGLPNIYCGLLSVVLLVLYFTNKKFSVRERIINGGFLIFILMALNINYLNYAWHGFHTPNQLPHRFAFVFSFMVVALAYRSFTRLDGIELKTLGVTAVGGIFYLFIMEKLYNGELTYDVIYVSMIYLVFYCGLLALYRAGKLRQTASLFLILLVVFSEGYITAQKGTSTVGSTDRASYAAGWGDMESVIDNITSADNSFYRMETDITYTLNPSALYSYRGVTQFSSSANSNAAKIFQQLGLAANWGSNRFAYYLSDPVVNSMLNVKYILNNKAINGGDVTDPYFTPIQGSGLVNAYKNNYYLPIAYVTDSMVRSWDMSSGNPFTVQNDYVAKATGGVVPMVFSPLEKTDSSFINMTVPEGSNEVYNYSQPDANTAGSAQFTFKTTGSKAVYLYISKNITYSINGVSKSVSVDYPRIVAIGTVNPTDTFTVTVTPDAAASGSFSLYAYEFDRPAFETCYAMLSAEGMNVTRYSDTSIEGTVTASKNGVLYTSIPYEKGWTAYVDGVKTDIVALNEGFVSLDISSGEHTIKFKYMPQGFAAGAVVSVVCIALLVCIMILGRKRKFSFDVTELKVFKRSRTEE